MTIVKKIGLYLTFIGVLVLLANCKKSSSSDSTPPPGTGEKVTASVKGKIIDESGNPIATVTIKSGTNTTTTDVNGSFRFDNIQLDKNAGFITSEKTGYLKGSRTIFTNAGVMNEVTIRLITKTTRGTFSATNGGTINFQNGSSVNFPANAIINSSNNSVYSGTVTVIGSYLDPTDPKMSSMMPGDLRGIDKNNEHKVLKTYGMIAIELEGSNTEKLNLASGKSVTLTLPIPSALSTAAPASIPLWFFDDTKGLWKEEGSATKQGNTYVGTVSHFSFWNVDVVNNYVNLKLNLKNQNNEPLIGYRVQLKNTQDNSTVNGYTDSAGFANGLVPSGVMLEMKIYNKCNTLMHSQNVGPITVHTDIGTISLNAPTPAKVIISGTVLNCSSALLGKGLVDISLEGSLYRTTVTNGSFSLTIDRCSSASVAAQIIATDIQTNVQSNPVSLNVTSGSISAGNIVACGNNVNQYVSFNVNGNAFYFMPPGDTLICNRGNITTTIVAFNFAIIDNNQNILFFFDGNAAPGTYSVSPFGFDFSKGSLFSYASSSSISTPINVTITQYGVVGQFVMGSFSGSMRDRITGATVSGTGTFKVKRSS